MGSFEPPLDHLDETCVVERVGKGGPVVDFPIDRQGLAGRPGGKSKVALPVRDAAQSCQRSGSRGCAGGSRGAAKDRFQLFAAFGQMGALVPEPPQGTDHGERRLEVAALRSPVDRSSQVVALAFEPVQPCHLVATQEFRLRSSGEVREVGTVRRGDRCRVRALCQSLPGVLTDRLEHAEARLTVGGLVAADEALVNKREEAVHDIQAERGVRVADRLRRLERPATTEDRQPPEQGSVRRIQQVVGPIDRSSECLLTGRQVPGAAGQEGEALLKARGSPRARTP